jgi:hypothetical protein
MNDPDLKLGSFIPPRGYSHPRNTTDLENPSEPSYFIEYSRLPLQNE